MATHGGHFDEIHERRPADNLQSLMRAEYIWRDHYDWLLENGYQLRPRYARGWVLSWKASGKSRLRSEDGYPTGFAAINDALRIPTGSRVALKLLCKSINPFEEDIIRYFSSEEAKKDPRNRCIPLLDVIRPPIQEGEDEFVFLVMPYLEKPWIVFVKLLRVCNSCTSTTQRPGINITRTALGFNFTHAYPSQSSRDFNIHNLMMDCSIGPAKYYTRTQRPPKYYIIDFGLSRQYDASNTAPLEDIIHGGDRTVPEFQTSVDPQNPFWTDVYYAGNLIREAFLDGYPRGAFTRGYRGLEFLRPLVDVMTNKDPSKRPTISEAVERFEKLVNGLSTSQLRSRTASRRANIFIDFSHFLRHWRRRIMYMAKHTPAIPSTTSPTSQS
ncbi:hypothetical protein D9613_009142 [Agrocybe pediades]|uniref:Protein kinase domain-containing protein n=1 Tax=Agrocybe pediades TaxID=84607 RepID=A0A8H4VTQ1_9AGAR|nr:hypothetical protein D9613_009142 [Agrocybe pediades]